MYVLGPITQLGMSGRESVSRKKKHTASHGEIGMLWSRFWALVVVVVAVEWISRVAYVDTPSA